MHNAWRMLAAAVLAQLGSSVAEQGLPILTGFIKEELAISAAAAGLVASSINIGRAIGAFRAGRAADDFGERRVLVLGGVTAGLLMIVSMTLPYPVLILGLVVTGVFVSAATPAGGKFVLTAFPRESRALALGVRQTGTPLGGILAAATLPAIATAWGWQVALGVAGAFAACTALAVLPIGGPRPHVVRPRRRDSQAVVATRFHEFLREHDISRVTLWAVVMVSSQYSFIAFIALDASGRADVPLTYAALLVAVAQAFGVIGRIGWGVVSDRLVRGARRPVLLLVTCIAAAVAGVLALTPSELAFWVFVLVAAAGGLSMIGWQGMWMTTLAEHAGPVRAGAATGFSLTFLTISSAVALPFYGLIHDLAGSFRASWAVLFLTIALSLLPLSRVAETKEAKAHP